MSNAGQAVLSIGGAIVGSFFGPAGAAWGFQLGGLAGSALFPTDLGTVNGPRLNDLSVQSSAVGAPIPLVYGTYAVSGNVIWSSGIIESVSRRRQGGKGGPTQTVREYSYSASVAVGLCEGPIGGISRIWADAKLIYDARPQLEDETTESYDARMVANAALLEATEIYLGSEDQLADPTIESYEGAGNVSAFRGLAYVVFTDFALADYGNRVPNFRFEITPASTGETVELYEVPYMPAFNSSGVDPRVDGGLYRYHLTYGVKGAATGGDSAGNWTTSLASALASKASIAGHGFSSTPLDVVLLSDAAFDLGYWGSGRAFGNQVPLSRAIFAVIKVNALAPSTLYQETLAESSESPHPGTYYFDKFGTNPGYYHSYLQTFEAGDCVIDLLPDGGPYTIGGELVDGYGGPFTIGESTYRLGYIDNDVVLIEQLAGAPPSPCAQGTPSSVDGYCIVDGFYVPNSADWEWVTGDCRVMSTYDRSGTLSSDLTTHTLQGRAWRGPVLPDDHPDAFDETFWTDAYNAAVAAGSMPSGLTFNPGSPSISTYPKASTGYYYLQYERYLSPPGMATIGAIVRDVCRRCGLSSDQVDTTDLTQPVYGYAITRVMSGRDAISPLRSVGMFDCVESGGVLKWPTRGKALVASFTSDDLGAHEAGGQRPAAIQVTRTQEVELPRRLRVHYAQVDMNYEAGEQGASRLSVGTDQVQDVELAIAMSDNRAAQTAEVLLYDAWISRNRYETTVDQSFLALEPADAVEAPVDGRMERLRIVDTDYSLPGLIRLALVRDDDGVYESYAVGAPAAYSGTTGSNISVPGTADLVLLDLPLLRDADNDAGYYAAVQATGSTSFGGAVLYRSPDGGITYDSVATFTLEATIGDVVDPLPAGPTTIIDEDNELLVDGLATDALESVSEASLLAGLNAAAIGDDGRWEIIQFRDAEPTGSPPVWRLTGLLRGRRGTEWAMGLSQAGDRFVLLDSTIARVPQNVSAIGAERLHKPVLVGTTLEGTTAVAFTGRGVALEPFAGVHVEGARDEAGDLTITWTRRDRLGQELPANTDIPMSEASESYEVDILSTDSPPDVLRTLTASSPSVTYTEAQQAEDFGSPVPDTVTVRIYQLSATVGRGYAAEATV